MKPETKKLLQMTGLPTTPTREIVRRGKAAVLQMSEEDPGSATRALVDAARLLRESVTGTPGGVGRVYMELEGNRKADDVDRLNRIAACDAAWLEQRMIWTCQVALRPDSKSRLPWLSLVLRFHKANWQS